MAKNGGNNRRNTIELTNSRNDDTKASESSGLSPKVAMEIFIWGVCAIVFAYFSYNCLQEYLADNSITVVHYRNILENEAFVSIKICNNVEIDDQKINNRFFEATYLTSYHHPLKSGFTALTAKHNKKLKLDIKQFMVGCATVYSLNESCMNSFKWEMERVGTCYTAKVNVFSARQMDPLLIDFYFDREFFWNEAEKSTNKGVFIALYHSEDFVSSLNGLFLGPSQQTAASIEIVHKTQNKPFRKAKCVHRYGLESHDFTGKPFQTQYSVASCQDICVAKKQYEKCNCSTEHGWNMTNTVCETHSDETCLEGLLKNFSALQKIYEHCNSKCVDKCNKKLVEYKTINIFRGPERLLSSLDLWVYSFGSESQLAKRLQDEITHSDNASEAIGKISKDYSRFVLYLGSPNVKVVDTVPLVSTASFVGNFGGLVGMWLGFSATSILQNVQQLFKALFAKFKTRSVKQETQ